MVIIRAAGAGGSTGGSIRSFCSVTEYKCHAGEDGVRSLPELQRGRLGPAAISDQDKDVPVTTDERARFDELLEVTARLATPERTAR